MATKKWTDEQVEEEIKRLQGSEYVKLAKKEQNIKYRRRQYLCNLQNLETRGKQLVVMGCDFDNIEEKLFGNDGEV